MQSQLSQSTSARDNSCPNPEDAVASPRALLAWEVLHAYAADRLLARISLVVAGHIADPDARALLSDSVRQRMKQLDRLDQVVDALRLQVGNVHCPVLASLQRDVDDTLQCLPSGRDRDLGLLRLIRRMSARAMTHYEASGAMADKLHETDTACRVRANLSTEATFQERLAEVVRTARSVRTRRVGMEG